MTWELPRRTGKRFERINGTVNSSENSWLRLPDPGLMARPVTLAHVLANIAMFLGGFACYKSLWNRASVGWPYKFAMGFWSAYEGVAPNKESERALVRRSDPNAWRDSNIPR